MSRLAAAAGLLRRPSWSLVSAEPLLDNHVLQPSGWTLCLLDNRCISAASVPVQWQPALLSQHLCARCVVRAAWISPAAPSLAPQER